MGIFAGTTQGVAGGVFQMVSHGIVAGALFLCVGVVYDRLHTGRSPPMAAWSIACRCTRWCSWCSPWPMSVCPAHPARRRVMTLIAPSRSRSDRRPRFHGPDPVGILCAVALSQGHLRHTDKTVAGQYQGSYLPRGPDPGAAGGSHHPVRFYRSRCSICRPLRCSSSSTTTTPPLP